MITPEGLEDQLLSRTVKEERPDLSAEKERLIVERLKRENTQECEDSIIHILSSSEGNILEDQAAIDALNKLTISDTIKEKQAVAAETEKNIDSIRSKYVPAAFRGQLLYFCIAALANIEPTYQYSLTWYSNLYIDGCRRAEKADDIEAASKYK